MDNFEKKAQKRSVTNMIGRAINPMEWIRQMSSSKYRRMIAAIDAVDRVMRNNITRLKPDLRDRLHQARMAFKNREFRKVFQYATNILDAVGGVFTDQMDELKSIGDQIYSDIYQDGMHDFEKNILEEDLGVRNRRSSESHDLVIEAGVVQWLQEKIPTKKEIEGALFDKIFKNMQGKQQEASRQALAVAEQAYNIIQEAFEALDNNRRNIVEYIKLAKFYQNKILLEKDRLRRMYALYFSEQTPQQQPQNPAPETPAITKPEANALVLPQTAQPVVTQDAPIDPVKAVDELIFRAKKAIREGDRGVGIALFVKASEICDDCGDDVRSAALLRVANNLDTLRGQPKYCIIFDEIQGK